MRAASGWMAAFVAVTLGACGTSAEREPPLDEGMASTAATLEEVEPLGHGATSDRVAVAKGCRIAVDPVRELMINALAVVEDPIRTRWSGDVIDTRDGAWSFGRLMTNMAGSNNASDFVRRWLAHWETDDIVNDLVVPARSTIREQLIDGWPKTADGQLDLTRSPMRLLAIVNRIDLRDVGAGHAGEGRFVFGALGPAGETLPFTVILEYRLPATDSGQVTAWATRWHGLGSLPLGSEGYKGVLQGITDTFAGKNASPGSINGSAIGQVRTNENALSPQWELREFRLGLTGALVSRPVFRTPAATFNGSERLGLFINENKRAILDGSYGVPAYYLKEPFQGGSAPTPFRVFWNAPGIEDPEARHLLSLNTCNGCHAGETRTPFLHVAPRAAGSVSRLSGFLVGTTMTDPVTGTARSFNDLARRKADLTSLLCRAR